MRGPFLFAVLLTYALASSGSVEEVEWGTKEDYIEFLDNFRTMFRELNGTIIPQGFITLYSPLGVDDYEAYKFMTSSRSPIGGKPLEEYVAEGLSRYPRVFSLLEREVRKTVDRLHSLSQATKERIYKLLLKTSHLRGKVDPLTYLEVVYTDYLTWPAEQQQELDQIFPQLSTKFAEFLPILMNLMETFKPRKVLPLTRFEEEL